MVSKDSGSSIDLHVWGIIDGTVRPIRRPGHDQLIFYNDHKGARALKFQAVTALDGLRTYLFGPVASLRHESGVLGKSGLLPQLADHMNGTNGIRYALYLMLLTHCPHTCRSPIKGQHLLRPSSVSTPT